MLNQFVIIYIDDILIYSPSLQDHHRHVTQVLQPLREHHLYLKKCEFHKTTIHFLGYIVTPAGVQMDQRKVDAVRNWPLPTAIKEMQRFLGFANFYRRFISHYSQLSAPLTSLILQKSKALSWTPEAHQAFQDLKQAFCAAPALTHPDPNLCFVVEVDAATLGVCAILSQWREQNYDVGNRELLAIKLAFEEWRHWLEGAQFPLQVITDHKNLQYLREAKRLNPRQARWALFFFIWFRFTSPTDQETRIPKLMLCHAFINLILNRTNLNPSYLPQCLCLLSPGHLTVK
ncbi:Transposon Tf2-9 polyprotein [Labeo rohita]|uniref:ribonuclease H n=1 Tax=Labeo rohita TaxID=84645 RepID=A0ABQ8MX40_LABRO|nr:Transposon Tf2-9 polyprotein [Labeo rohita]